MTWPGSHVGSINAFNIRTLNYVSLPHVTPSPLQTTPIAGKLKTLDNPWPLPPPVPPLPSPPSLSVVILLPDFPVSIFHIQRFLSFLRSSRLHLTSLSLPVDHLILLESKFNIWKKLVNKVYCCLIVRDFDGNDVLISTNERKIVFNHVVYVV